MERVSKDDSSADETEEKIKPVYVFDQNPKIDCLDQFHRPFTYFEHIERTEHEDLDAKTSGSSVTFPSSTTPSEQFFYPYQHDRTRQPKRMDVSKGFFRREHTTDKRILWEKYRRHLLWKKLNERVRYNKDLLPELLGQRRSTESMTYNACDLSHICLPSYGGLVLYEGPERQLHLQSLPDIFKYVRGIKPSKKFKRQSTKTGVWQNVEKFEDSEGSIWKFHGDYVIKPPEKKKFSPKTDLIQKTEKTEKTEKESVKQSVHNASKSIVASSECMLRDSGSEARELKEPSGLGADSHVSFEKKFSIHHIPKESSISANTASDTTVETESETSSSSEELSTISKTPTDSDESGTDLPLFVTHGFENTSQASMDYNLKPSKAPPNEDLIRNYIKEYIETCSDDDYAEFKHLIKRSNTESAHTSITKSGSAIGDAEKYKKYSKSKSSNSENEDKIEDPVEKIEKQPKIKCIKHVPQLPDESTIDGSNLSYLNDLVVQYPQSLTLKDINKIVLVDDDKQPDYEKKLPMSKIKLPTIKRHIFLYKRKHAKSKRPRMKYRLKITHKLVPHPTSGRVFTHKKPLFTLDLEDVIVQSAYRPINQYTGEVVTRLQLPIESMRYIDDESSVTYSSDDDKGEENYVLKLKKEVQRREMQRAEMRLNPQYTTQYLGPKMGTSFLERQQLNRITKEYTLKAKQSHKTCSKMLTIAMREHKIKFKKGITGHNEYADEVDDTLEFFTLPPIFHTRFELDPNVHWSEPNLKKGSSEESADLATFRSLMADQYGPGSLSSRNTLKSIPYGGVSFSTRPVTVYAGSVSPSAPSVKNAQLEPVEKKTPSPPQSIASPHSPKPSVHTVFSEVLFVKQKPKMSPANWTRVKKEMRRMLKYKIEKPEKPEKSSPSIIEAKSKTNLKKDFDIKHIIDEIEYKYSLDLTREMENPSELFTEMVFDSENNIHTFYPLDENKLKHEPGVMDVDYLALVFEEREISYYSIPSDDEVTNDDDSQWEVRYVEKDFQELIDEQSLIKLPEKDDFTLICDCVDATTFGIESTASDSDKSVSLMFKMFVRENPGKGYEEIIATCKGNIFKALEGRIKSANELEQLNLLIDKKDSDENLIKGEGDDENDSDESNVSIDMKKHVRQRYIEKLRRGASAHEIAKRQVDAEERTKRDAARLAAKTAIQSIGQQEPEETSDNIQPSDRSTEKTSLGTVDSHGLHQDSVYSLNIAGLDDATSDIVEPDEKPEDDLIQMKMAMSSRSLTPLSTTRTVKLPVSTVLKKRFHKNISSLSKFLVRPEMTHVNKARYRAVLNKPPNFLNPWDRTTRSIKIHNKKTDKEPPKKAVPLKDLPKLVESSEEIETEITKKFNENRNIFESNLKNIIKKNAFGNYQPMPESALVKKPEELKPKIFNLRWHYFPTWHGKRFEGYDKGPIADKLRESFDPNLVYQSVKVLEINETDVPDFMKYIKFSTFTGSPTRSDSSSSEIVVQEFTAPKYKKMPCKSVLELEGDDSHRVETYLREIHRLNESGTLSMSKTPVIVAFEKLQSGKVPTRLSKNIVSEPSIFIQGDDVSKIFKWNDCLKCWICKFKDYTKLVIPFLQGERKALIGMIRKCVHNMDSVSSNSQDEKKRNQQYNMDWIYSKKMRFPSLSSLYKIQDKQLFCVKNPYQEPYLHKIKELHLGMKIGKYLKRNYGIQAQDIIPPDMTMTYKHEKLIMMYPGIHFLPLETFDNTSFDIRTTEEWMSLGWSRGDHCFGVPAIAFIPSGNYQLFKQRYVHHFWTDVAVYDYDYKNDYFAVFPCSATHGPYLVKRIYICFIGENPVVYCDRLANAVSLRNHAEYKLRFRFFKDCVNISIDEKYEQMSDTLKNVLQKTAAMHPKQKEIADELMARWEDMFRKVVISKLVDKFATSGKGGEIFYMPIEDPRPFHWGKRKTFDCNEDETFKEDVTESEVTNDDDDDSEDGGTNPHPFLVHKHGETIPSCACMKTLMQENDNSILPKNPSLTSGDKRPFTQKEHETECGIRNGLPKHKNCWCFIDPKYNPANAKFNAIPGVKWATRSELLSFVFNSNVNTLYEKMFPGPSDKKHFYKPVAKVRRRGQTIVIKPKKSEITLSGGTSSISKFKVNTQSELPLDKDPINYQNLMQKLDEINDGDSCSPRKEESKHLSEKSDISDSSKITLEGSKMTLEDSKIYSEESYVSEESIVPEKRFVSEESKIVLVKNEQKRVKEKEKLDSKITPEPKPTEVVLTWDDINFDPLKRNSIPSFGMAITNYKLTLINSYFHKEQFDKSLLEPVIEKKFKKSKTKNADSTSKALHKKSGPMSRPITKRTSISVKSSSTGKTVQIDPSSEEEIQAENENNPDMVIARRNKIKQRRATMRATPEQHANVLEQLRKEKASAGPDNKNVIAYPAQVRDSKSLKSSLPKKIVKKTRGMINTHLKRKILSKKGEIQSMLSRIVIDPFVDIVVNPDDTVKSILFEANEIFDKNTGQMINEESDYFKNWFKTGIDSSMNQLKERVSKRLGNAPSLSETSPSLYKLMSKSVKKNTSCTESNITLPSVAGTELESQILSSDDTLPSTKITSKRNIGALGAPTVKKEQYPKYQKQNAHLLKSPNKVYAESSNKKEVSTNKYETSTDSIHETESKKSSNSFSLSVLTQFSSNDLLNPNNIVSQESYKPRSKNKTATVEEYRDFIGDDLLSLLQSAKSKINSITDEIKEAKKKIERRKKCTESTKDLKRNSKEDNVKNAKSHPILNKTSKRTKTMKSDEICKIKTVKTEKCKKYTEKHRKSADIKPVEEETNEILSIQNELDSTSSLEESRLNDDKDKPKGKQRPKTLDKAMLDYFPSDILNKIEVIAKEKNKPGTPAYNLLHKMRKKMSSIKTSIIPIDEKDEEPAIHDGVSDSVCVERLIKPEKATCEGNYKQLFGNVLQMGVEDLKVLEDNDKSSIEPKDPNEKHLYSYKIPYENQLEGYKYSQGKMRHGYIQYPRRQGYTLMTVITTAKRVNVKGCNCIKLCTCNADGLRGTIGTDPSKKFEEVDLGGKLFTKKRSRFASKIFEVCKPQDYGPRSIRFPSEISEQRKSRMSSKGSKHIEKPAQDLPKEKEYKAKKRKTKHQYDNYLSKGWECPKLKEDLPLYGHPRSMAISQIFNLKELQSSNATLDEEDPTLATKEPTVDAKRKKHLKEEPIQWKLPVTVYASSSDPIDLDKYSSGDEPYEIKSDSECISNLSPGNETIDEITGEKYQPSLSDTSDHIEHDVSVKKEMKKCIQKSPSPEFIHDPSSLAKRYPDPRILKLPVDKCSCICPQCVMHRHEDCDAMIQWGFASNLIGKEISDRRFLEFPSCTCEKYVQSVDSSDVDTTPINVRRARNALKSQLLLTKPEIFTLFVATVKLCEDLTKKTFFDMSKLYLSTLDAVCEHFNRQRIDLACYINGIFRDTIKVNYYVKFQNVKKGYYCLKENDWDIYNISNTPKFLRMLRYLIETSLRILLLRSLSDLENYILQSGRLAIAMGTDFEWKYEIRSRLFDEARHNYPSLFILDLKIGPDGPFYTNSVDNHIEKLHLLIDKAVLVCHNVPMIDMDVNEKLHYSEPVNYNCYGIGELEVVETKFLIQYVMKKIEIILDGFKNRWEYYHDFYSLDIPSYIQDLMEKCNYAHELEVELNKQQVQLDEYQYIIPEVTNIGPFAIVTSKIKYLLTEKRNELINGILNAYAHKLGIKTKEIISQYNDIFQKVLEKTRNIEHLTSQKEWMETVPNYFTEQEEAIYKHLKEYDIFDRFFFNLGEDDLKMKWMVMGWPEKIITAIKDQQEVFEEDIAVFRKLQSEDEVAIQERIEFLSKSIAAVQLQDEKTKVHEIAQEVSKIWKLLRETVEWGRVLNHRQRLFGDKVTPFTELTTLTKAFTPFKNLWATASDWLQTADMFLDNPLVNIDPSTIEGIVNEHAKTMSKCIKLFAEIPACQKIAEMIKELIEEFKPHIPIIQALCAKGMRKRHWEEFQAMTGIPINWTPALTYKECINLGVHECGDALAIIADQARKEYVIEVAIDKMVAEWENCLATITPFKDSDTYIFKLSDEVFQMLEDHIETTQSLQFSPSKGPFEAILEEWGKKLSTTQKTLEKWVECQQNFMYLYPIFTSADIATQLVNESKKFANVLRMWRKLMNDFKNNPQVMNACCDHKVHDLIGNCSRAMSLILAGLNQYLHIKRTGFPRFYFLSDEELVEILSKCSDPQAVQPHLKKCFENIYRLTFNDKGLITAMHSGEGEEVKLKYELKPIGSVDNWLCDVEKAMRDTVHSKVTGALSAFAVKKVRSERNAWVLNWPGQIIIVCSQIIWTGNVEMCLSKGNLNSYYVTQLGYLDNLRSLIRGDLTKLQRLSVSALIVIDVHARDVTEMLLRKLVMDVHEYDWTKQLRYYFTQNTILLRAINAEFPYGYEYLGNSGRLVITPLTDRCYLTLIGALHLKFGGAPAGPAGTGKTETTKDLAKAFAVQCVVFNCSDQLNFMAMGKFFKGLATCGAWACFDEFNRIDIEVLSVVAQQITTIQRAQMARQETFLFEGEEIALKPSCAVFVTMNPGYAGRTELPDNLKALFRPVAMMVPDYTLIAEISLFSFGFTEARLLAAKITSTFKLSSEQLSTQDHYDFGMRAVKTVIAVAGNMKKEDPSFNETLIVLRALKAVNVPKFLIDDSKLFSGILSDLFPNIEDPPIEYGLFQETIEKVIDKKNLYRCPDFITKVIQLYDTTVVRHGLMLIGPAGAGKTKCYEVLQDTMGELVGIASHSGGIFQKVHVSVINPKAINMGQIYGEYDLQTHEWSDGVLAKLMREGAIAEDVDKRWYLFDGPVDAVWIENMNTLLDDNKKLCLTSGEIIKMTEPMTMMFEVGDLAVASPATVSRCGMVYMEPNMITLEMLIQCWFKSLPKGAAHITHTVETAIRHYMVPSIQFLRTKMQEIVKTINCGVINSALKLLEYFLSPLFTELGKPPPSEKAQTYLKKLAPMWVIWSTTWSIGATCNLNEREKFALMLSKLIHKHDKDLKFPKFFAYDYWINDGGFTMTTDSGQIENPKWVHWLANVPLYEIPPASRFIDIEVPTIDSIRNAEVLGKLIENMKHVLVVGPTGSGKTITILSKINRNMSEQFVSDFLTFTARTSLNQTRDTIESKLEKRKKLVIGPPVGKKGILFIDDFNMPAIEKFGSQPPLELIRQYMDFGGWYDTKVVGAFKNVEDVCFVGAMGPPGGGRNKISERLLRHFHILAYPEFSQSCRKIIFGTILNYWMAGMKGFSKVSEKILNMTLKLYSTIEKELLPTPAKTHYTYNLRDLSKVFQGMLLANPEDVKTVEEMLILWIHECTRVFADRLINDKDRLWFRKQIRHEIDEAFQIDYNYLNKYEPILFGDFMNFLDASNYVQITDFEKLSSVMNSYLQSYNNLSTAPMSLVLFMDAIEHVCRIVRIIKQPQANGLLLGIGGSGRRSLTKLSSFMTDHTCVTVEPTRNYGIAEWRDDLKKMMYYSGVHSRETVFLFSDSQILNESFLEDVNSMLNSGDIPNIYLPEDLDKIYAAMRTSVIDAGLVVTKANLFSLYLKSARTNLHVIFTMSPIGEDFRSRLRQFPALVNCCTIDWFSLWPDSALENVAEQYVKNCGYFTKQPRELIEGVVHSCKFMHLSVVNMADMFFEEYGCRTYISPTKYLILLHTYVNLMFKTKTNDEELLTRFHTGLEKLLITAEEVNELREAIKDMQPILKESRRRAEEMANRIESDKIEAEKTKTTVANEEKKAQEAQEVTMLYAAETEKDLEKAMPALRKAEAALLSINKTDITEVKAMKRPPAPVVLVMEVLCLIKNIPPNKLPGKNPGEKILDYWEPARNMLGDPGAFLKSLIEFDRDAMTEETIKKIEPYIKNPRFTSKNIKAASIACKSLFTWIHAIYDYYFINKTVAPKRAAYNEAKAKLDDCQKALERSRNRMKKVLDGLVELEARLVRTQARVQMLEQNEQNGINKLELAEELLNSLDDEKKRWIDNASTITNSTLNQTGNLLICAATVAYFGPFSDDYRRALQLEWTRTLNAMEVPNDPDLDCVHILSNPLEIRRWQLSGLPKDFSSTENAILSACSLRFPLFIDPTGQANKWIKGTLRETRLIVQKFGNKELLRELEGAVSFGRTILIENIGLDIDPILDPVLNKQIFPYRGNDCVKFGDNIIPFNDRFMIYFTTRLRNPTYTPEVCSKVNIINFTLSVGGLEDQLLSLVVSCKRPDLEEQKSRLVESTAEMKIEIKNLEDKILTLISSASGSPLDDLTLIEALKQSKEKSETIREKVDIASKTAKSIDETRVGYAPVARRAQILYFCIADMSKVDPMYQYSLDWFTNIFTLSLSQTDKSTNPEERNVAVNNHFTYSLFTNVCRSLFEKNRLQFTLLICIRMMIEKKQISKEEFEFFLTGGNPKKKIQAPQWFPEQRWLSVIALENLPQFESIITTIKSNPEEWKFLIDDPNPYKAHFPMSYHLKLSVFQRLMLIRFARPDKLIDSILDYISHHIGTKYIEPLAKNVSSLYADSTSLTPLLFVLSPGTDPAADFQSFAEKQSMAKRVMAISLGQGQGPIAEEMFNKAVQTGGWIFFQNCHLAPSWMPRLEQLIDGLPFDFVHKDFRIWLTSTPSTYFPSSILENGNKMTIEPPRGVKANLLRAYTGHVMEYIDAINSDDPKNIAFKGLLFSLCLFHSIILERRKFGPLGFNIAYEFTDGDLRISINQLHMFIMEYENVPYKVLSHTAGDINYGGRVTDDWDRRCIRCMLSDFYNPKVLVENYMFDLFAYYYQIPFESQHSNYVSYIKELPINDETTLFGLHSNANITYSQGEANEMIKMLLSLQPQKTGKAAATQEAKSAAIANEILDTIPPPFTDLAKIQEKYPITYEESLNTVLYQEILRYNKLLYVIQETTNDLLKAIAGLVVMSEPLEKMSQSLYLNRVPEMWAAKGYPSLMPLGAWSKDLKKRISFLIKWIDNGRPANFWISGFFFPQAFLTGILQNYARTHIVSVDSISYSFIFLDELPRERKADGCVIYGLFLEGARWNQEKYKISESLRKVLYTDMAPIWLKPDENIIRGIVTMYNCPVYKTLKRVGTLSTTGHSTNYVLTVDIPTKKTNAHWVQRGVALICALDYC